MCHNFFIHSSLDEHLGCFHVLVAVKCCNEHWGSISWKYSLFNYGFLRVYAQQWDCWVVWQFYSQFFKEISTLFSTVAVPVCIPTNSVRGFPFLHTLSRTKCIFLSERCQSEKLHTVSFQLYDISGKVKPWTQYKD